MDDCNVYGVLDIKDVKIKSILNTIATCNNMGIPIPKIIKEFFSKVGIDNPENLPISHRGVGDSYEEDIWIDVNVKKWSNDIQHGIEIDIENLPKDVKKIRVVNSY